MAKLYTLNQLKELKDGTKVYTEERNYYGVPSCWRTKEGNRMYTDEGRYYDFETILWYNEDTELAVRAWDDKPTEKEMTAAKWGDPIPEDVKDAVVLTGVVKSNIREEQRDLFSLPHGWWFAHCISKDFALGAGIAKTFDELYGMKALLMTECYDEDMDIWYCDVGDCIPIGNVYNLITKERCFHKPTYEALEDALKQLRENVDFHQIKKLAMPRIGCGLDRLDWKIVKPMIEEAFDGCDAEILICYI